MLAYILFLFIALFGGFFILTGGLYLSLGWFKFFYHGLLGWHRPDDTLECDGVNIKSTCKYCGKEIMQDSQGNWF